MSMPTCSSCIYAQGICEKTGVKIHYSTGCTYYNTKPMTNADRIRAMSYEELAKTLSGEEVYPWCTEEPCKYDNCTDCVLAWLKQEAET